MNSSRPPKDEHRHNQCLSIYIVQRLFPTLCVITTLVLHIKQGAFPRPPQASPPIQAFLLIFFSCFFPLLFLSFSRKSRWSSALMWLNLLSRICFLFFSPSSLLSSAFSSSLSFRNFFCSSSRTVRILRVTSGRKCAVCARRSGRRRK